MAEKTYQRLSLAKEQLDVALSLFLDQKSYAASLTLAGASECIFGEALSQLGETSALENLCETMSDFHEILSSAALSSAAFKKKAFTEQENLARDALKHLQERKGSTVVMDLEEAACWMLVRALENAKALGMEFERERDFSNWFYENVVGI